MCATTTSLHRQQRTAPWPSFSMPTPIHSNPSAVCRRVSLRASPTLTSCSVHLHNTVAKKHDCAMDLLTRLYTHVLNFDVDFIADDFNMSATMRFLPCPVRMATSVPLLAAHHYWALVGPTGDMRIAWSLSTCPNVHLTGSCKGMAASHSPMNSSALLTQTFQVTGEPEETVAVAKTTRVEGRGTIQERQASSDSGRGWG